MLFSQKSLPWRWIFALPAVLYGLGGPAVEGGDALIGVMAPSKSRFGTTLALCGGWRRMVMHCRATFAGLPQRWTKQALQRIAGSHVRSKPGPWAGRPGFQRRRYGNSVHPSIYIGSVPALLGRWTVASPPSTIVNQPQMPPLCAKSASPQRRICAQWPMDAPGRCHAGQQAVAAVPAVGPYALGRIDSD